MSYITVGKENSGNIDPFLDRFFKNFYNTDVFRGERVRNQVVRASWNILAGAPALAKVAAADALSADFREDASRTMCPR